MVDELCALAVVFGTVVSVFEDFVVAVVAAGSAVVLAEGVVVAAVTVADDTGGADGADGADGAVAGGGRSSSLSTYSPSMTGIVD